MPWAAGGSRGRRWAPHVVLGLGLVVLVGFLVHRARSLWFFGDDFDFLLHRTVSLGGDRGLLVPHNEHWSTVPILLFRLNFALFGLHHYLPYALVPIVFHLLVCVLVHILLRRCGVGPWVAVATTLVVAYSGGGAGAENTLWDFQVGFLGSCLFGLVALVQLTEPRWGRAGTVVGLTALVLSLMSSGMGVVMVIWATVLVLAREGVRAAVLTAALPLVVYVAWYLGYGRGHTGAPPPDLSVAPVAALRGLGTLWSSASDVPGAGPVLLLAMVAAVVLTRRDGRLFALAGSGLVATVAMYALLGYSRSGIGADATVRSRYVYIGVVMTAPALAAGLQVLARVLGRWPTPVTAVAWLALAATTAGVGMVQADRWASSRRAMISDSSQRLVAAARLVQSGSPLLRAQPMPRRNPDIDIASLARPSVRAALPDLSPDRRARLNVAVHLQVDVAPVARGFAPPARVTWRGFDPGRGTPVSAPGGGTCETRRAGAGGVVEMTAAGTPAELRLTVDGDDLGTQLASGGERSPVVHWTVQAGVPVQVATSASDATLRLVVPAGPVTLCGLPAGGAG